MQGIRYITKLNHLGHVQSILSCHKHVNTVYSPKSLSGSVWRLVFPPSFPTKAFTAADTVIISVIGSIGEAGNFPLPA
jgi:hypothetical protein